MLRLKRLELTGFKSFAKKTEFRFESAVAAIVGPNGSGKSNATEAFRWVLGERSMKSLRSGKGEDLIWNGGHNAPRASRAGVTLVFDNSDRYFNLDYDEVQITREVYRDGNNVYMLNGSPVRYKDLAELLATASLGSSDHYIINQGEADRVLVANPRERRSLVEDALGLRLYQWKILESRKKLAQTSENLERVASLRREIAPHLKFLKKQVEKIERADQLRRELKTLYLEYLKREDLYLAHERALLQSEREEPERELQKINDWLNSRRSDNEDASEQSLRTERSKQELAARELATRREQINRQLGRLEGMIELKRAAVGHAVEVSMRDFTHQEVAGLVAQVEDELDLASRLSDIFSLKNALVKIKDRLKHFLSHAGETSEQNERAQAELDKLLSEQSELNTIVDDLAKQEVEINQRKEEIETAIAAVLQSTRLAEREIFEQKSRRQELENTLSLLNSRVEKLKIEEDNFARELTEAKVLVDQEISQYKSLVVVQHGDGGLEARSEQEARQKRLERLKIKLEDMGVETGDTMKEYRETTERDEYLAREISDLEAAALVLESVIAELVQKIDQDFQIGLVKINQHFQEFFALMFGGGEASLSLLETRKQKLTEEEILEASIGNDGNNDDNDAGGLEVKINLPRKKVRGLEMLSGGERALVSIALLFALSQVNPPPFLVLDETDAALDEANSRKYGDMVASLAQRTQLILVTHNRETMSRAGVIYGVTMGNDGVSKLLSIKFDEAAQFAK